MRKKKVFSLLLVISLVFFVFNVGVFAADEVVKTEIVIVGGGGAGLTAAISAAQEGAEVILIEKMAFLGGNTRVSGGIWNVAKNPLQVAAGFEDSPELHITDTIVGGDYLNSPELVGIIVRNALPTTEWLRDEVNVDITEDVNLAQLGGHSVPRGINPVSGDHIITPMIEKVNELGVEILMETEVVEMITNQDGDVTGVKAVTNDEKEIEFKTSKAVILTTGGFGANVEMRKKYNPEFDERYLTTNLPFIDGSGIKMAQEIGAGIRDMEQIQAFPTCDPETGHLSYVASERINGGILVNQEGERFVEELERRDVISEATLAQTGKYAYTFWDQEIAETGSTSTHPSQVESLARRDLLYKADTIEEVAEFFDIPVENLEKTVERYNSFVINEEDKDFNRRDIKRVSPLDTPPYYLTKFIPAVHHTMGGVKIDVNARVLNEEGEVIKGLFAAGEVTGGIHGTNRLGGNAITDLLVFGKIAGRNAAAN